MKPGKKSLNSADEFRLSEKAGFVLRDGTSPKIPS
jgi:hypothetical protein